MGVIAEVVQLSGMEPAAKAPLNSAARVPASRWAGWALPALPLCDRPARAWAQHSNATPPTACRSQARACCAAVSFQPELSRNSDDFGIESAAAAASNDGGQGAVFSSQSDGGQYDARCKNESQAK